VPWCDTCDRLVDDDELVESGACPTCSSDLYDPEPRHIGWRFRLLVLASVGYLVWRCVQGVQWLTQHA
jgi:uncharacterized paraquat-inducible protein A